MTTVTTEFVCLLPYGQVARISDGSVSLRVRFRPGWADRALQRELPPVWREHARFDRIDEHVSVFGRIVAWRSTPTALELTGLTVLPVHVLQGVSLGWDWEGAEWTDDWGIRDLRSVERIREVSLTEFSRPAILGARVVAVREVDEPVEATTAFDLAMAEVEAQRAMRRLRRKLDRELASADRAVASAMRRTL